jgi:hypothetical protein
MREMYKPNLELKIYRARVHDVGSVGDDRLQVRIMPYMADYSELEDENLPRYPCMFKGQVLSCYTELNPDKKTNLPDWVFVAATEDFTVGYVIGLANQFYTCNNTPFLDSYGYTNIQNFISSRGLDTYAVNYDEMVVEKWISNKNSQPIGGMVEMYNYRTGEKYIILTSGTCLIMQYNNIYMRVGNPSGTENGKTESFSEFVMNNNKIEFKTDLFNVDAKNVVLGQHQLNLLATGATSKVSLNGMEVEPIKTIKV